MKNIDLIHMIEQAAEARGVTPSYLCRLVFNDGKVIKRLQSGGTLTLRRLEKLKSFVQSNNLAKEGERHEM